MVWMLMIIMLGNQESKIPDIAEIFMKNRRGELSKVLSGDARIQVQLSPLLHDHGNLSRDQVLMSFDKLQDRFFVREALVTNTQSDTNYAWLEVYLNVILEDKQSHLRHFATFAFHYKIIGSRIAIGRWVLQDIH